jgi:hypothetical protein
MVGLLFTVSIIYNILYYKKCKEYKKRNEILLRVKHTNNKNII